MDKEAKAKQIKSSKTKPTEQSPEKLDTQTGNRNYYPYPTDEEWATSDGPLVKDFTETSLYNNDPLLSMLEAMPEDDKEALSEAIRTNLNKRLGFD